VGATYPHKPGVAGTGVELWVAGWLGGMGVAFGMIVVLRRVNKEEREHPSVLGEENRGDEMELGEKLGLRDLSQLACTQADRTQSHKYSHTKQWQHTNTTPTQKLQ